MCIRDSVGTEIHHHMKPQDLPVKGLGPLHVPDCQQGIFQLHKISPFLKRIVLPGLTAVWTAPLLYDKIEKTIQGGFCDGNHCQYLLHLSLIHISIPGTAPELVEQMGFLADRLSVNIELPSEAGLRTLAPDKTKQAILAPMGQIRVRGQQSREELVKYRHAPRFAPADVYKRQR